MSAMNEHYEHIGLRTGLLTQQFPVLQDCLLTTAHTLHGRFSLVLVSWCGVRLSPLGTSATNWPIVPAPDNR
jgi:hypothetical protein